MKKLGTTGKMKMVEVLNRVIFNILKIDRRELRAAIDFNKCEFKDKKIEAKILKKLKGLGDEKDIKNYIDFVKKREESGEITWEQFIERLEKADPINSDFGILFQRFGNGFERVFFDSFDFGEIEDKDKQSIRFICDCNFEAELKKAKAVLHNLGIDTDCNIQQMMEQIADMKFGPEDMQNVIAAMYAYLPTHYASQQYLFLDKKDIKSIYMSGADLVPDVGLRDYTIEFNDGQRLECRFAD